VRSNFFPPSAYRLRFYRAQSLSCPEIAVLCGVAHGAGGCEREQGLIPDSNFDFEEEETGMGTVPEEGTAKQRKIETGEGGGGGGGGGRRPAAEYPPMKRARTAGSGRSLPLCSLRGGIPVCCHWHTETRRTSSAPASVRASVPDERASVPRASEHRTAGSGCAHSYSAATSAFTRSADIYTQQHASAFTPSADTLSMRVFYMCKHTTV
jgi:hypothetical protein